jgi:hypothetical protein
MNSLFPLFEAVANGFHAIEERFAREASKNGEIIVEILRDEASEDETPPVRGFRVSDNGIGLDEDHWVAFLTADTPLKIKRGGKGVGRLAWLKVLKNAAIVSVFETIPKCFTTRGLGMKLSSRSSGWAECTMRGNG